MLWEEYSQRVPYARVYQKMIAEAGGAIANDHIAFRSLRMMVDAPQGRQSLGIDYLGGVAEVLGYEVGGEYTFPNQKLYARHYRHPQQEEFDLPKLFISELLVDELPDAIAHLIYQSASTNLHISQDIFTRPWDIPKKSVVEAVNQISQYGAWVLLHGYSVNHFTGYVNRQNTPQYPDIESTAKALSDRGVPMKAEIEGSKEIGLRQTATQAVTEMVSVRDDETGGVIAIPWTYAYYELAERSVIELETGEKVLFDGFKQFNAQHLFEMTKKA